MDRAALPVSASDARMRMRATSSPMPQWTTALAITSTSVVCVVVRAFCWVNATAKAMSLTIAVFVGGEVIPEGLCDCEGNVLDQCGECGGDGTSCLGCTDPNNPGYDPSATIDDGSCLIGGCVIPIACNYDSNADYQIPGVVILILVRDAWILELATMTRLPILTMDCARTLPYYDCDGNCLNDTDGDGICDELEDSGLHRSNQPWLQSFCHRI